jgi:NAD(P)-dependent dehydrogenase (short-subunit alcohol dehydrogenase family)
MRPPGGSFATRSRCEDPEGPASCQPDLPLARPRRLRPSSSEEGSALENDVYLGLDGRAALVMAGGSGVGKAIAIWLARAGCDVAIADVDGEAAESVAEELRAHDYTAIAVTAGVATEEQVEAMVGAVLEQFDALEVAVNDVAAMTVRQARAGMEAKREERRATGERTSWCCRAEARAMAVRGQGGVLLNVYLEDPARSSGEGREAGGRSIESLTRTLAIEHAAAGVRVNALMGPAHAASALAAGARRERLRHAVPLGRLVEPDDLGRAAVFLVSDLSRSVTGQILRVEAGGDLMPRDPGRTPGSRRP